jgi:sodium-coupled monocarboxylate transporter 8/12
MGNLSTVDLAVFLAYLGFTIGVGVRFTRQQKDLRSYLLADQGVHWFLVSISVIAALFSGITYLGAPAEAFHHDLTYIWTLVSFLAATPITALVFLPFFYNLRLVTAYEYLERRFDSRLRLMASALFLLRVTIWLAIAVYAPALAINQATGLPLPFSILLTGASTTFYTAMGGMKAVIWTDTIQFGVLFGGILLILAWALTHISGGLPAAWALASAGGKTHALNLSLDPHVRVTVWAALLGGCSQNLVQMVTDQVSVQRYLTAPSLKESQRSLWFKLLVTIPLVALFYLAGTALYAFYQAHPDRAVPLVRPDGLLPSFIARELPTPLPGLLIAAIFGSTMSAASAGLNALTGAFLVDFVRPRIDAAGSGDEDPLREVRRARWLTVCFGCIVMLLALQASRLGSLIEAPVKAFGVLGGPLLGVFFLGVLSRRANGNGALVGAVAGSVLAVLANYSWEWSFLWVPFFAATTTAVVGWVASHAFAAPSAGQQALVFRPGRQSATTENSP